MASRPTSRVRLPRTDALFGPTAYDLEAFFAADFAAEDVDLVPYHVVLCLFRCAGSIGTGSS